MARRPFIVVATSADKAYETVFDEKSALGWRLFSFLLLVLPVLAGLWLLAVPDAAGPLRRTGLLMVAVVLFLFAAFGLLFSVRRSVTAQDLKAFCRNQILAGLSLGGLVLLVWPGEKLLPNSQSIIGTVLLCMGLAMAGFYNRGQDYDGFLRRNSVAIALSVLLGGFALGVAFAWERQDLRGVGVMGIIVLVATLLACNILSRPRRTDGNILEGMRTSMTLSTIAMFYAFVSFGSSETLPQGSVLGETVEHFWAILLTIVGFYFGAQAVERVAKSTTDLRTAASAHVAPAAPARTPEPAASRPNADTGHFS